MSKMVRKASFAIFAFQFAVAWDASASATLAGRVETNAGSLLLEAAILIHRDDLGRGVSSVPDFVFDTDNGRFSRTLNPGTYDVCALQSAFIPACIKLKVDDGKQINHTFVLMISREVQRDDENTTGVGLLRGFVMDASGAALINVLLFIRQDPVLKFQMPKVADVILLSDARGQFELKRLSSFYDVCALAAGRTPRCEKVRVRDGRASDVRISLRVDRLAAAALSKEPTRNEPK